MHDMQEEAGAPLNSGATPTVPPSRVSGRPLALVAVAALGVIVFPLSAMFALLYHLHGHAKPIAMGWQLQIHAWSALLAYATLAIAALIAMLLWTQERALRLVWRQLQAEDSYPTDAWFGLHAFDSGRIWQLLAAATRSCSGLGRLASPRKAASLLACVVIDAIVSSCSRE
mgnify:CR=1 FL=1